MDRKSAIHSIVLLLVTFFTFIWASNEILFKLSLQLTAILLILLIIGHHILKTQYFKLLESIISTTAVLLVTAATGGVSSPLFFLNYFLLFELSFILEPVIPLILSVGLVTFYFFLSNPADTPLLFAMILAFPFMTPLAFLFGEVYHKEENQKKEIKHLAKKVEELKEEVLLEKITAKS